MGMNELEVAFTRLNGISDANFHGAKSEVLVAKAERALGLKFPPTYRQFLKKLGCGNFSGYEIYGLVDDDFINSSVPDAIWLALDERKNSDLPSALIPVAETGDGGYYVIDTAQVLVNSENPVVEWRPGETGDEIKMVATDFGAFLLWLVQQSLNR